MARGPADWGSAFDRVSRSKGDAEAANSYVSVGNFLFVRAKVLSLVGEARGADILDVGCGTGHMSQPLARGNRVVGVDLSAEMLRFARNKGLAAVRAPAEALPFRSASFDVVLATSVIQLIPDGRLFAAELVRVAKPDGRVVLTTINAESAAVAVLRRLERAKYRRFRLYPVAEMRTLLAEAGGEVRKIVFLYFPFGRAKTIAGEVLPGFSARRLASTVIIEAVRRR